MYIIKLYYYNIFFFKRTHRLSKELISRMTAPDRSPGKHQCQKRPSMEAKEA